MNGWCQYTFRAFYSCTRKAHACGISRKEYVILLAGSRSTPWDMRIRRCEALNEQANRFWHTERLPMNRRRCDWRKKLDRRDPAKPNAFSFVIQALKQNEAALKLARKLILTIVSAIIKSGIVAAKTRSMAARSLRKSALAVSHLFTGLCAAACRIFVMRPITI